ncbi:HD domain-containing protein [Kitasatospora sp. NBC_01287]|uniref:HD domain-containing protein n=1 Tax=Kitasatospora sp. NBC_01287 TaxID=2903573 RepID=UPI00225BA41B|nr:HD domain-containing protein [Kitasatospora sp. NBC_01287]MCX4747350.1 HD domain-containing protein [Kitasatospora sp. NBC_01287]
MPTEPHPATDVLLERWSALLERCGATTDPAPYGRALLARWAEPQRRYHTTDHLLAVLDEVDALAEYAEDPDAVRLAAWFHDAVYQPDRSENEERSAQLAIRALGEAGLAAALIERVVRLVRLTADHHPRPGDRDGEVLCDADLAVLGRPAEAYAAYTAAVREEYAFVPEEAFRDGRAAILRQLLELPALYRTPEGHTRYDGQARANLAAELSTLTS